MTNEQLAALLQHIGRQINGHTSDVEKHLEAVPELDTVVRELRGLSSLLFDQAKACGGILGGMWP